MNRSLDSSVALLPVIGDLMDGALAADGDTGGASSAYDIVGEAVIAFFLHVSSLLPSSS